MLVTNNHVINEDFLDKENKINYSITENEEEIFKEINLEKDRYKLTNKELDFTIIEILKEDNINSYLEINKDHYNKEDLVFSFQYPGGGNLQYSHGKILAPKMEENYLLYDVGAKGGSSGSPIILMNNSKIIGLHKGYITDKNNNKINTGIRIELIIDKIPYQIIKCTYEIKDNNNYIQIINNRGIKNVNEEIESKVKILNGDKKEKLIFKKKFNKIGINIIYFIIEEKLTDISFLFNNCSSLKEINFISFETDKVNNMGAMF